MKKFIITSLCTIIMMITGVQVANGSEKNETLLKQPKQEKTVTAESGCETGKLQALLNTNQNGEYNLTLEIPAGTYNLTRTLYVWPNTTIHASSNAKMIKTSRYGSMVENKIDKDNGGYDTSSNITIDGGIWESTPVIEADQGTESFRFIHCNGINIKNLTLCNVPSGSHLIVFAGVLNASVTNCKLYGYGIDGQKKTPKEAIQLDTVHSSKEVPTNQKDYVKWDDMPCNNIVISGCEIFNYSRGIGSHTTVAGKFHTNVQILNNNFHDLSDSAIRLYNYKNSSVNGNHIENAVAGILAYTYIEAADGSSYFKPLDGQIGALPTDYDIQIKDNTIKNMNLSKNNWGDGIRLIGSSDRPMKGVTILGNTISDMERYGIFATNAPNVVILNSNNISKTKKQGILVEKQCDNAKISGNTIVNNKTDAISIYNSKNVIIEKNKLTAKENGIRVALESPMASVQNNTINSAGKNGIWISSGCNNALVKKNVIKKYAQSNGEYYGIYIYQAGGKKAAKSSKITENTIIVAGKSKIKHGIKISESTYILCNSNTIKSATGHGIYIYKSKCSIINNNKIISPRQFGIWISTSPKSTIKGNKVSGVSKNNKIKIVNSPNCKQK